MDFAKVNIIGYETVAQDKTIKGNVNVCGKTLDSMELNLQMCVFRAERRAEHRVKKKSMSNESEKTKKTS